MKVCVYAIAKNEEKNVDAFMSWAKHADLVIVGDTGSEDKTKEIFSQYENVEIFDLHLDVWRFDEAKNIVLNRIPKDVDICVCADLDEVFNPLYKWREIIEENWKDGINRIFHDFEYRKGLVFRKSRIHSRNDFEWKYAVHEKLFPVNGSQEKSKFVAGLIAKHYQDVTKSRSSYIDLLKITVEEYPDNFQQSFWYIRELISARRIDEAIEESHRFMTIPGHQTSIEYIEVLRKLGVCYFGLKNYPEAEKYCFLACANRPDPESWINLGRFYYNIKNYEGAFFGATQALKTSNYSCRHYLHRPEEHREIPLDIASLSAFFLGMKDVSAGYIHELLQISQKERYLYNHEKICGPDCPHIASKKD